MSASKHHVVPRKPPALMSDKRSGDNHVELGDWEPFDYEPSETDRERWAEFSYVSATAPAWLEAYARTGNVRASCERVGINRKTPYHWMKKCPEFREVYEETQDDVRDRWQRAAEYRAVGGFEERMYDKNGDLAGRRVRQDPSFLRNMMTAIHPDWRRDDGNMQVNVQINLNQE